MDPILRPESAQEPDQVVQVLREHLSVHKSIVDNGGVRLTKRVHADVVEIDEPLSVDAVKLTRVPIGREVEGPVEIRYEDGVTIIPVVEERLVIRRQRILVEEIHLARSTHIRRVPQSVTVRREEVMVERQRPGETDWHIEAPSLSP
jgi:uncharacterized protein (TIGR02271 family)